MKAYLVFTLVIVFAAASPAQVLLPEMASDLRDISCQIRIVTRDLFTGKTEDAPHGSGTFIKENLFVTAAHCVSGFYYPFHTKEFVKTYLACPGGRSVAVKSWIVHPQFFNPQVLDSAGRIDYPISIQGSDTYPAHDMAVLVTETVQTGNIKLAFNKKDLPGHIESRSCRALGYSPNICDFKTGENCPRQVDLSTQKLKHGFLTVNNLVDFSGGDSGSGIVCGDSAERYLVGIFRSRTLNEQGLAIASKRKFLEPLLTMSAQDLLAKAAETQFSPKFIEASLSLSRAQRLVNSSTDGRLSLNIGVSVSDSAKITAALQKYILSKRSALSRLEHRNIKYISIRANEGGESFVIRDRFLYLDSDLTEASLEEALSNL